MVTQPDSLPTALRFAAMIVCFVLLAPAASFADCSEAELTAVLVVSDIYPLDPQLELLDVAALGPVTNPSKADMIEAIEGVQPGYQYEHLDRAGPFHLFFSEPQDYMACAIVDGRDGRVVFAGTVIWSGIGSITVPAASSHSWSFPAGEPAPAPVSTDIFPNAKWPDWAGTEAEITDAVVDYLRGSDVLRSFGDCDSYSVVSYIYTPSVAFWAEPSLASSIIIVSGRSGPPWNDVVSATPLRPAAAWMTRVVPNPFNPRTTFILDIPHPAPVRVAVYALDGRLVAELANRELTAGEHSLLWNGLDSSGNAVASGTYVARLTTPGHIEAVGLTLLR